MKLLIAIMTMALAADASAAAARTGSERWIVTFKGSVRKAGRDKALDALGLTASKHIATNGDSAQEVSAAVVEMPLGKSLHMALGEAVCKTPIGCADALKDIVSVEKDQRVKWVESAMVSFQNTPLPSFGSVMEGLKMPKPSDFRQNPMSGAMMAQRPELPWGVNRVRAPAAWDYTDGKGVRVAVIDTGIDLGHPDLIGKVDGGYSAIAKTENPEDYADDQGHGTHVAATIAAKRDDKGVVGVAPGARLYSIKVLDAEGSGNLSDVIDGIVWAANNDMQVVNMSLGAPIDSPAMQRAVRYARGKGAVIVAAAGNSGGSVGFPGAYEDVIAVAAADYRDQVAPFSSRGPEVDFIAPGVDVVSAKMGGGLVSYSGTSMAAPHVAGMAALAVAQGWVGLGGPDGVFAQLKKAAKPLPELGAELQGSGMIDAGKLTR